jgi:hypothetical protein
MVRTVVVGFVKSREWGAVGGIENPEGEASGNNEGNGADRTNDSEEIREDDAGLARWGVVRDTARDAAIASWYCSSQSSSSCRVRRFCERSALACCFSCSRKITTGSCPVIASRAVVSETLKGGRLSAGAGRVGTASLPRCLDVSWSRLWARKLQPGIETVETQHCLHMRRKHCMHPRRLHPGFEQSITRDVATPSRAAVGKRVEV